MTATLEFSYWLSVLGGLAKPRIPIIPYVPNHREPPARRLEVISAWEGIQDILSDLIDRFRIKSDRCLEFGVEFGFSTVALSSYFNTVIGVDSFCGDRNTFNKQDIYGDAARRMSSYPNIELVRSDYRSFIQDEHGSFDLIHVDIVHTFADTFVCGLWSAQHSQCTIFHDTESFPQVKQAVLEIARATGKRFHNFPESCGLGILV
jgi:hypothetical protein